ncbi:hypothetical protein ACOME3_003733 [Neoechinorhynchus agilis]
MCLRLIWLCRPDRLITHFNEKRSENDVRDLSELIDIVNRSRSNCTLLGVSPTMPRFDWLRLWSTDRRLPEMIGKHNFYIGLIAPNLKEP